MPKERFLNAEDGRLVRVGTGIVTGQIGSALNSEGPHAVYIHAVLGSNSSHANVTPEAIKIDLAERLSLNSKKRKRIEPTHLPSLKYTERTRFLYKCKGKSLLDAKKIAFKEVEQEVLKVENATGHPLYTRITSDWYRIRDHIIDSIDNHSKEEENMGRKLSNGVTISGTSGMESSAPGYGAPRSPGKILNREVRDSFKLSRKRRSGETVTFSLEFNNEEFTFTKGVKFSDDSFTPARGLSNLLVMLSALSIDEGKPASYPFAAAGAVLTDVNGKLVVNFAEYLKSSSEEEDFEEDEDALSPGVELES